MTPERQRRRAAEDYYRSEARRIYGAAPNVVEPKAVVDEVASRAGAWVTVQVWIDAAAKLQPCCSETAAVLQESCSGAAGKLQ